ncbi:MAG: hypothetical protein QGG36_00585 [Pirellulaceae bacterium]|jgi:hypothetical protein|nr:hypothetical protein [Pirellulaceae bacterium]MDP7014273.1 hypothetical protein [Pirellulaceae bacterium]
MRCAFVFVALLCCGQLPCAAQQPRQPANKLAADFISVKRGPKLYGAFVRRDEAGNVSLFVERAWLKKTHPRYYKEVALLERERSGGDREVLVERVKAWRESRSTDTGLRIFLDKELKRLGAAVEAGEEVSRFLIVEILADELAGAYIQQPATRQMLLAAWENKLKDPVVRTAASLRRELQSKGVMWEGRSFNFASETAASSTDSKRQWAARVGIVEYRLRKKVDFQGSGAVIKRTGDGAKDIDLTGLLSEVLKDQVNAQLAELLGGAKPKDDRKWVAEAIRVAESEGVTSFRVSRLRKDLQRKQAEVTIEFFAKLPDGKWEPIWVNTQRADATRVDPKAREEVLAAPEIQRMIALMKATGLPLDDSQLQLAIGFGAATKESLRLSQLNLVRFLETYATLLDRPELRW